MVSLQVNVAIFPKGISKRPQRQGLSSYKIDFGDILVIFDKTEWCTPLEPHSFLQHLYIGACRLPIAGAFSLAFF